MIPAVEPMFTEAAVWNEDKLEEEEKKDAYYDALLQRWVPRLLMKKPLSRGMTLRVMLQEAERILLVEVQM